MLFFSLLASSDWFTHWGEDMDRIHKSVGPYPQFGVQLEPVITKLKAGKAEDWSNFLKAGIWKKGTIVLSDEQINLLKTTANFSENLKAQAELMDERREDGRDSQPLEGTALTHASLKVMLNDAGKDANAIFALIKQPKLKIKDYDFGHLEYYVRDLKEATSQDWQDLLTTLSSHNKTKNEDQYTDLQKTFDEYKAEVEFYEKKHIVLPQVNPSQNPDDIWILLHGMDESAQYFTSFTDKTKQDRCFVNEFGFLEKDSKHLCIVPQAGLPFYTGIQTGHAWVLVGSLTNPDELRVYEDLKKYSRSYLNKLVADIRKKYPGKKINLIGMSLGAIAALDVATHAEKGQEFGTVISFAGGFKNTKDEATKDLDTEFFLLHSNRTKNEIGYDPYVSSDLSVEAVRKLRQDKVASDPKNVHLYHGVEDHGIQKTDASFARSIVTTGKAPAECKEIEIK